MATFVNNLRLKEIATGDESGTWGTSTNTNLELITDGFSFGTKQMSADANQTFTMPDATADATRGLYLKITSAASLTATRAVTLGPNTINKVWIIENATTGGQSITIKQGSGGSVEIATTATQMLYADGAGSGAAVAKVASAAGGVSYVAKTANYTTKNLEGVLANTNGGAFTVTLPQNPSVGDQVVIADSGGAFGTNNCIAGRNGSTIEGTAADLNLNINGVSVQFVYSGSTWEVYAQVGGNGGDVVTLTGSQTLTNKTINYANNTLTGVVGVTATQTLTNKTLTAAVLNNSVLGGTTSTASGNMIVSPATQIVEVKGDGSSVEGQIKLNCHANTHGQTVKAQPHSENITNTMLLPKGANSTLVSEVGAAALTNKTISGATNTLTVDGTDAVGFRNIPQNSQSAAYTLVLADSGKHIFHPAADTTARTYTIPANASVAYPIGTAVTFINMTAAVVSIAITTDVMYLSEAGTTGTRSLARYGSATAVKITATNWVISGSGLT